MPLSNVNVLRNKRLGARAQRRRWCEPDHNSPRAGNLRLR